MYSYEVVNNSQSERKNFEISNHTANIYSMYREFSTYANFITANFVTAVFQSYYYNFANVIFWTIHFVNAFIS